MLLAAVIYGIAAMFAGGVSNALLKDSVSRFGPVRSAMLRAAVSSVVLAVAILVIRPSVSWDLGMTVFTVAVSLLGYFPFLFMLEGFRKGKVGVVVPVASGWIVIAALFSAVFFGETYSPGKLAAFVAILGGIIAVSVNPKEWGTLKPFDARTGIPFALAAALLWGVVFPLFKVTAGYFGAVVFAWIIETTVALSALLHLTLRGEPLAPRPRALGRSWLPFTVAGVLTALYTVAVSEGYQTGEIGIVSALAGSGVVVAVIVAALMHRERLAIPQYLGVGLVLLGTVIASII
ncbi:MAG: EamA family transporter [Patescibacteria group bacterium]